MAEDAVTKLLKRPLGFPDAAHDSTFAPIMANNAIKQIHSKLQRAFGAGKEDTTSLLAQAKVCDARPPG